MNINRVVSKWKEFTSQMNKKGIPVPTIRDPKNGQGSVSLTLVFISSVLVIAGIIGKWSKMFGNIDIDNAMQFFWTACTLYWGRKFQPDEKISTAPVAVQPTKVVPDDPDSSI